GGVQDHDAACAHLVLARREAWVLGARRPPADLALHGDDELAAALIRRAMRLGRLTYVRNRLNQAAAVPQVDEDQAALVPAAADPAVEGHRLANVFRSQRAASAASFQHFTVSTTSSNGTDRCSPESSSFHVTSPRASSSSPRMSTPRAPRRF